MKLSECEILPGVVIDNNDPERIGRVKASVPTWFDVNVMQKEAMPWIYPLTMNGYQRYSKLEKGRKIWVLHNYANNLEYWYWPMFEKTDQINPVVNSNDSTEILFARGGGSSSGSSNSGSSSGSSNSGSSSTSQQVNTAGSTMLYYNDNEGVVLNAGDLKINMSNNSELTISDSKSSFKLKGGQIFIGNGDDGDNEQYQYVVLGEKLQTLLLNFCDMLNKVAESINKDPYLVDTAPILVEFSTKSKGELQNILSTSVKISK